MHPDFSDTIIALSTPAGMGAIAVIRLSGEHAIRTTNELFKGKDLQQQASHTLHFGKLMDGQEEVDEIVAAVFKSPHSYTKEDVVEISCHGSPYIVNKIITLFLAKGVRLATPGEFTQRAFMNGRFDLSQAEAVADLIASDSQAGHKIAM
ncbi:MAG TPA: tRNA uridine-5-carboxymethylaminomethyl(34) synthesis GTPase MnmE, partial [Chitinophagales bacterium]|nr:tRNA uridine-5-carboxymethylaminomethyl(34) synthesis GTPase MnmE [Chitinophagales bacterium]